MIVIMCAMYMGYHIELKESLMVDSRNEGEVMASCCLLALSYETIESAHKFKFHIFMH